MGYKVNEVFGISTHVNPASYVDRKSLDKRIRRLLERNTHIALKGASKSGKSWLRQQCIPASIVIQCRYDMDVKTLYRSILRELGVELEVGRKQATKYAGELSGDVKASIPFVGQTDVSVNGALSQEKAIECDTMKDEFDLKFIANKLIEDGRRLIIEDFHYMSEKQRKVFAYDLKTFWDYECYIIIVGVWTQTNLLTYMNPDLTGRIEEISISWSEDELRRVIEKGSGALNIGIDDKIINTLVQDAFGNVGLLQSLLIKLVDEAEIEETCEQKRLISDEQFYTHAAQQYAGQLDGVYQQFAKNLSAGIRHRKGSTGIYALTMQAIVESEDRKLCEGLKRTEIYEITHAKEKRIQKGNLKIVLQKLGELQNKSYQGNLVVSYDDATDAVTVVDMQLLFYRKHHTMVWPWEEIVEEAKQDFDFEIESDEDS